VSAFLAVLASVGFGVGVALQRREALHTAPELSLRPGLVVRLVRRPLWLAGLAAEVVGFGLQAAALQHGSLVLVQPILATPVIVALVLGAVWWGEQVATREWLAMAAVIAGLAVFLVATDPRSVASNAPTALAWALAAGATLAVLLTVVRTGSRARGVSRATLLGAAAGLADGFMAALAKTFAGRLEYGVAATARSWAPYAVVFGGLVAVLLTQSAYQAGHPTVALPVITVIDPLAGAAIGLTLFGDRVTLAGGSGAVGLAAAFVVLAALVVLSRGAAAEMVSA